jgi:hypothetical protein
MPRMTDEQVSAAVQALSIMGQAAGQAPNGNEQWWRDVANELECGHGDREALERVRAELDALASEWADPANQQEQYTEAVVCNCVGRISAALNGPQGGGHDNK